LYTLHIETGEFIHYNNKKFTSRRWLGGITYNNSKMEYRSSIQQTIKPENEFKKYLKEAVEYEKNIELELKNVQMSKQDLLFIDENAKKLKWFLFPSEALAIIRNEEVVIHDSIISPLIYNCDIHENDIKKVDNDEKKIKLNENIKEEINLKEEEENKDNETNKEEEINQEKKKNKKKQNTLWPKVPMKEIMR
jgi:hypothetical protein